MPKKVLVVLSGTEKFPNLNRATGIWLGEVVHFVDKVGKAGYEVDHISPKGGYTPIDPRSLAMARPDDWEWYRNKKFMRRLGATLEPSEVDPGDYSAIYFVGGHGAIWDFPDNEELQALSRRIYETGGVVSAVCHGAAGLLNTRLSDGTLLIKGKKVTGFSNEEEKLSELDQYVPFRIEDELVKRGGIYTKAAKPWAAHVVADRRLVTGQNPESAAPVADLVLKELRG
jgi:putative intracellular protease/amidase